MESLNIIWFPKNKCGMTLIELIISSTLVGIIMVGAISVEYAIRTSRINASLTNQNTLRVQAALLQMSNDAMQTIGYAGDQTTNGVTFDNTGAVQNICFRYEPNDPPTSGDYTDDRWTCYSHDATNILMRCTGLTDAQRLGTDEQCAISPEPMIELYTAGFFDVSITSGTLDYIKLTIESLASCSLDATKEDASEDCVNPHVITNPSLKVETSVNPPGVSG